MNYIPTDLMTLKQAAALLPGRTGGTASWRTVYKWSREGINGHRLETMKAGGLTMVSRAALVEFIATTTADAAGRTTESVHRGEAAEQDSEAVRRTAAETRRKLESFGIKI